MILPEQGDLFAGQYRVDGVLGEGAFGTVFAAEEVALGRRVALKILKPGPNGYASDMRQRFLRERKALATLQSPHTVVMLNHGEASNGLLFAVFEYLGGEELAALLNRRGRLELDEIEHVLRQLLDSLGEAHRNGLLHRDLKPENIVVFEHHNDPLRVKLIDFGIARPLDSGSPSVTKTGELIGTPRYMSPEQLTARPLTAASDVYSLGIIVMEMAVGSDSLHGGSLGDQLERLQPGHVFTAAEAEQLGPLGDVVLKMTARDPADRFRTAAEVLRALDPPTTGPPGRARPGSKPPTAKTTHWRMVGLAGGLLLVGSAAFFAAKSLEVDRSPAPPPPTVGARTPVSARPATPNGSRTTGEAAGPNPIVKADDTPLWHSAGCFGRPSDPSRYEFIPDEVAVDEPLPLVVLLHDARTDPAQFLAKSGFIELAQAQRFMVYAPLSRRKLHTNVPWTGGGISEHPIVTVSRDIQDLVDQRCVDRRKVYLVGHGAGGKAVEELACSMNFAGAASVAYLGPGPNCLDGAAPLPMIRFNPIHSKHQPPLGGPGCGDDPKPSRPLSKSDDVWAKVLGCETSAPAFSDREEPQSRVWTCATGAFESHLIAGGSPWPGLSRATGEGFGECEGPEPDVQYAERIWDFFQRHPPAEAWCCDSVW